jgi:hypothetical protein
MSSGSTAYASFVRIHTEMGRPTPPHWCALSHVRRMAWEAAAQAVALSVLPNSLDPGRLETDDDDDNEDSEEDQEEVMTESESRIGF